MVSSGVQMMGRGEDTKDDGICFTFFYDLTSFSRAYMS